MTPAIACSANDCWPFPRNPSRRGNVRHAPKAVFSARRPRRLGTGGALPTTQSPAHPTAPARRNHSLCRKGARLANSRLMTAVHTRWHARGAMNRTNSFTPASGILTVIGRPQARHARSRPRHRLALRSLPAGFVIERVRTRWSTARSSRTGRRGAALRRRFLARMTN
jgi:hypothetical protein